jgi:hypothetical protein
MVMIFVNYGGMFIFHIDFYFSLFGLFKYVPCVQLVAIGFLSMQVSVLRDFPYCK